MVQQVTSDHKPESEIEKTRIFSNGGHIFRSKKCAFKEITSKDGQTRDRLEETRYGPYRVDPGGLSVSRTIGDLQAKDVTRNGNPRCIIANADIYEVELTVDTDFAILACDGVFDVATNVEVSEIAWKALKDHTKTSGLKEACKLASEAVMKLSFDKKSMDNITVIVIAFQDEKYY